MLWFVEMSVRSEIVFLLVLISSGILANDCEREDGSSVFELSSCFSCSGCYRLVEFYYNTTLETRANFSTFYEHFLNLSQLNISQLASHYQTLLMMYHSLALGTSENERNLTFHLPIIANGTIQANKLSDMLKRNLSFVMNGSHDASITHANNVDIYMELEMLVNIISDIASRNITVVSQNAEFAYDQILTKLKMLTNITDSVSSVAHRQEDLTMAADFAVDEAFNISTMAFDNLCLGIDAHNATSDLVSELSSHDAVSVMMLQQEINKLFVLVQQTISENSVFETSRQLIDKIVNISIPHYNVESLNFTVHDVIQNVSELVISVKMSLDELESLEGKVSNLSNIVSRLLELRRQLDEEAGELFTSLNESFFMAEQSINMAQSYIKDIRVLRDNLTDLFQLFNDSITDVFTRLEVTEYVTEVANNVSVDGQNSLNNVQQLRDKTDQLLDGATGRLIYISDILDTAINKTKVAFDTIEAQTQRGEQVIDGAEEKQEETKSYNETTTNHLSQLTDMNSTATTVEDSLNLIEQNLMHVREQFTNLTAQLQDVDVPDDVIEAAKKTVTMAMDTVDNNGVLLSELMKNLEELEDSSDELEEKYKQLKQHRDLLQHILNNIGKDSC